MEPLISIIVPIYKVESFVEKCIKSIIAQTYKNLDIILVLGQTGDACEDICRQYVDKDKRIKLLICEPRGLSDARNRGIEAAQGEFIGFVDGDDWIEPDMYEKLLSVLLENDADISVCGRFIDYVNSNDVNEQLASEVICLSPQEAIEDILYMKRVLTSAWDKLYDRNLFDEIRYPVGRTLEDLFTTYKLFHKAKKIAVTSRKEYHYRVRKGSLLNTYNVKGQKDADDVLVELEDFIKRQYPQILPSVNCIYVRTYFACLRHNLENTKINKKYAKTAVKRIRSRAWGVICDKKTPIVAKAAAMIGSGGIFISSIFFKLFDHRRNKSF